MATDGGARRFRVAMVVASPFPANHGTPGSIREMCEALAARGDEIHVVTYPSGDGTPPPAGVAVHRVRGERETSRVVVGPTWHKPFLDLRLALAVCRVVWEERIDVVHAHNYEGALIGFVARVLTGRPLVYSAVNTMSDELPTYDFIRPRALARLLGRVLDAVVPRLGDAVVVLSEELARFLRAQRIAAERIDVIPLGIDFAAFAGADGAAVRRRLGVGSRPLVVYTGILNPLQRIDHLLRAMAVAAPAFPDALLLLVVNILREEDAASCRALAAELGIADRVRIVESGSFAEVPGFLAAADVTVVPRPHCPGFPVKLLNYLAAGRPVVVFAGSAKGLPHGEAGLVVADHDWAAMGEAIRALLGDRALAARLGLGAREWAERSYAWPALAERMAAVYARVTDAAS